MALPQVKEREREYYTYADYLKWDESFRAELHDGKVMMMAPPTSKHQQVSMELSFQIRRFLEGKPCKVFAAPYSVRLFPEKESKDDTVFEPDIVVVCDPKKRDAKGCNGPPDLVIEILSPSTATYDCVYKLQKYQKAKVREYWIVDPETKAVQVFVLKDSGYFTSGYEEPEKVPVSVLEGCVIDLRAVFQ
ncbi:MAG: Uma2 family endonuclease [Treponema sp.]|nr:Uma2 family endonuclease [Treponema sp.]